MLGNARVWSAAIALALLAAAVLLCYAPSRNGPFIFDDLQHLVGNEKVRIETLDFASLRDASFGHENSRPVAFASFALTHWLGDGSAPVHRRFNVLLHILTSWLVGWLVWRMLSLRQTERETSDAMRASFLAAVVAAFVFALHPLQSQSVSYVIQRMASLAAFFYLASVACFLEARAPLARGIPSPAWWGGCVGFGLLALGTKQNALTLPLALGLIELCFLRTRLTASTLRRLEIAVLASVACVTLAAWWGSFDGLLGWEMRDFDALERLLTQLRVVVFYGSLVLWPAPSRLNLAHHFEPSRSLVDPASTLASGLLLAALCVGIHFLARRERGLVIAFGLTWVLLHLAIESSVVPLELAYEHRMYLPFFGLALIVATLGERSFRTRPAQALGASLVLCTALGTATWSRNHVWSDSLVLWRDAAAKSPRDARTRSNFGNQLHNQGRVAEALAELDVAVTLDPPYPSAFYNRGVALNSAGRPREAIDAFRRTLELSDEIPHARANLGATLHTLGRSDEAVRELLRAAESPLVAVRALSHAATIEKAQGRLERAAELLAQAARRSTRADEEAPLQRELAVLLAESGDYAAAQRAIERAIELAPNDEALQITRRRIARDHKRASRE